jgi:hypothetical protein
LGLSCVGGVVRVEQMFSPTASGKDAMRYSGKEDRGSSDQDLMNTDTQ